MVTCGSCACQPMACAQRNPLAAPFLCACLIHDPPMRFVPLTLKPPSTTAHGPAPPPQVLPLAWEVACAVDYLHANDVVHGDLKVG